MTAVRYKFLFFFSAALDQTRFKAGGYCDVCKTAVSYIDSILEKNSTEAEIEEAVRKVCSFLPSSLQTEVRCVFLPLITLNPILTVADMHLTPLSLSTVWPAGSTVWANACPASAPDAWSRLFVHGKSHCFTFHHNISNVNTSRDALFQSIQPIYRYKVYHNIFLRYWLFHGISWYLFVLLDCADYAALNQLNPEAPSTRGRSVNVQFHGAWRHRCYLKIHV